MSVSDCFSGMRREREGGRVGGRGGSKKMEMEGRGRPREGFVGVSDLEATPSKSVPKVGTWLGLV
jgi:hypothetical protein